MNRAAEALTGIPGGELVGKTDRETFAPAQADYFTSQDRKALADGVLVDIPEEVITTRHRGDRWLHTRKIPIVGPDGRARYLLGISEDVTERRRADEALRRSEARLRSMVEHLPAGAVYVDGEQPLMNPGIRIITGYEPEELPTVDVWFRTLYAERHEEVRQLYHRDREGRFANARIVSLRRKDGASRTVEISAIRTTPARSGSCTI